MALFAVQYLEDAPEVACLSPREVGAHLRAAAERLPLSLVLLGWDLPPRLREACTVEAARAGAALYLWHPLLTGAAGAMPRPEWQTVALDGRPAAGYRGLPEFTFICPNRPAACDAALARLRRALEGGPYAGVFLDRIRFPSPARDPIANLACFCPGCQAAARDEGLDLEDLRRQIAVWLAEPTSAPAFAAALLDPSAPVPALRELLAFRCRSITRMVQAAAVVARAAGASVGLDCFAPALAPMVGQGLAALDGHCDWIKVMAYGHAFGPAALPFELSALAGWLVGRGVGEAEALACLARAAHLPLPATLAELKEKGLGSQAIAAQVQQARPHVTRLLAGVELVEIPGVAELDNARIAADLRAVRAAGADGLVLSWDLRHIPLERLDLVRAAWS